MGSSSIPPAGSCRNGIWGELGSRLDELNRIGEKRELIDWFANGVDGVRSLTDMAKTLDKLADNTIGGMISAGDRSQLAGMALSLRRLADQLESITS